MLKNHNHRMDHPQLKITRHLIRPTRGGAAGVLIVFAFLLSVFNLARVDSGETSALFAAVLGVNLGEMIFYSVGGLGILMWALLSLFAVSGTFQEQCSRAPSR